MRTYLIGGGVSSVFSASGAVAWDHGQDRAAQWDRSGMAERRIDREMHWGATNV